LIDLISVSLSESVNLYKETLGGWTARGLSAALCTTVLLERLSLQDPQIGLAAKKWNFAFLRV